MPQHRVSNRPTLRFRHAYALVAIAAFAHQGLVAAQGSSDLSEIDKHIDRTLNGKEVLQASKDQQRQNQGILKSISEDVIAKTQAVLPKLNQIGAQLRYGDHKTVTNNGDAVIWHIRRVASGTDKEKSEAISALRNYAQNNVPEAIHFFGFAHAYGLFGFEKNLQTSKSFFKTAAAWNYQPSVFNLAIFSAYGMDGKPDLAYAVTQINKAYEMGPESSYRVCGIASFLNYRIGNGTLSARQATGCPSPLAYVSIALTNPAKHTLAKRIEQIGATISTGIDDGYRMLEMITYPSDGKHDPQYTYCKYAIINRMRIDPAHSNYMTLSTACINTIDKIVAPSQYTKANRANIIKGVAVSAESTAKHLKTLRSSNKTRYSMLVPFLPFSQSEQDLFDSVIK